jgi:uncharacterized membrane protein YbaN (DUF454 family)
MSKKRSRRAKKEIIKALWLIAIIFAIVFFAPHWLKMCILAAMIVFVVSLFFREK